MEDNKLHYEEGLLGRFPSSRYSSSSVLPGSKSFCFHAKGLTEAEVHTALHVFFRSFKINSIVIRKSGGI
jgi:hypothetical protein